MGRPVRSDGRQTRQAILDAALELFSEKGYFGTSLRDIATVVGVRESALYNYFTSKEALFTDLLATVRPCAAEQLAEFFAEPITDVRSTLERLTDRILDQFCEPRQQRLFRVLMSDGMRLAKQGHIDLIERMTSGAAPFYNLMRRLISDRHVAPADPELLAMEFMGPLLLWRHFHAISPDLAPVINRRTFVRDHVNQFLRGAETRSPGRAASTFRAAAGRPSRAATSRPRPRLKIVS
jgi:AcrR family transcriptional regulator